MTVDEDGTTHFHGHPALSAEMARNILRRLKMDNDTIDKVSTLVRYHDYRHGEEPTEMVIRKALNKVGADIFPMFLEVRRADVMAQSGYMREEKLENIREWERIYRIVLEKEQCFSVKQLKISGKDLIESGMKPGPVMGEVLSALLDEVIEDPDKNNKEFLLGRAKELAEQDQ